MRLKGYRTPRTLLLPLVVWVKPNLKCDDSEKVCRKPGRDAVMYQGQAFFFVN